MGGGGLRVEANSYPGSPPYTTKVEACRVPCGDRRRSGSCGEWGGSLQWEPSIAIAIACYKPKPEKISPLANDKEPKSVSAMTKLRMLRNLKGGVLAEQ